MKEIWKDIFEYEGLYQISNLGNVKRLESKWVCSRGHTITRKEHLIKGTFDKDKYLMVHLSNKNKNKRISVHRLVAQAFIPNPNNLPQINHINGNKTDNRIENLEWCNSKENINHAIKKLNINYGRYKEKMWEANKKKIIRSDGKIYNQVKDIFKDINTTNKNAIFDVLKKRRKEYKGYEYKYY